MYVLRDSLFLQDVLDLVDLIVAMGLLPIIDGTIQSGGKRHNSDLLSLKPHEEVPSKGIAILYTCSYVK